MKLQYMIVSKGLSANITAIRFFLSMGPHVNFQLFGTGESLLTSVADIRFVSRVSSHVDDKLTTLNESFVANLAVVWMTS